MRVRQRVVLLDRRDLFFVGFSVWCLLVTPHGQTVSAQPDNPTFEVQGTRGGMWDELARALGRFSLGASWNILKYWESEFESVIRRAGVKPMLHSNTHVFAPCITLARGVRTSQRNDNFFKKKKKKKKKMLNCLSPTNSIPRLHHSVLNAYENDPFSRVPYCTVRFCGGDALTALAVDSNAHEYVLVDRWAALRDENDEWPAQMLRWNASLVEQAAEAIATILESSHAGGYQFGYLVKEAASKYGVVAIILGAIGTRTELHTLDVTGVSEDVVIRVHSTRRKRPHQSFVVRYVTGDMHDVSFVNRLQQVVATNDTRVLTLLKGTEAALSEQRLEEADLKGMAGSKEDAAVTLRVSRQTDAAKRRAADAILDLSHVVVQDATGVPYPRLARWATVTHLFGTFAVVASSSSSSHHSFLKDPDRDALGHVYASSEDDDVHHPRHSLGRLRFGYCVDVDKERLEAGDATLAATYAALEANAPKTDARPLKPAFDVATTKENNESSDAIQHYCHMIVACGSCRPPTKTSSAKNDENNDGRRRLQSPSLVVSETTQKTGGGGLLPGPRRRRRRRRQNTRRGVFSA